MVASGMGFGENLQAQDQTPQTLKHMAMRCVFFVVRSLHMRGVRSIAVGPFIEREHCASAAQRRSNFRKLA